MPTVENALSTFDLERIAGERLEPMARAYYESGSEDELALRRNRQAFEEVRLAPRVMVDVSRRTLATSILGESIAMPVMVAPTAFHGLADPGAEVTTRRGVSAAGTVMTLSTLSNSPVEEVVAAASGPVWFQLYMYRDRGATRGLVERVEAAGCSALVLTADAPVLGFRHRDVIHRFALPSHLHIANMLPAGMEQLPAADRDSGLAAYFATLIDPSLSWADLEWLRSITELPIVLKGVLRPQDAIQARDAGCGAVVVSNHGGRQLDAAPATIDALPAIADAVGDSIELLVDGGVRRGVDVVKALALGARAVLVGRPILWGLAAGGEAGVKRVFELFAAEIDRTLALCGCPGVTDIGGDLVFRG
jgi:4-hydroxymandelate oxidase